MKKQHPLSSNFTFWFQVPKSQKTVKWEESMLQIGSFETVEDFWKIYQHLAKIEQLPIESGFQLFLTKVKPMWEDPSNQNGGRFVMRVKKNYSNYFWEHLLMAYIANPIQNICGFVSNVKENEIIISIWVKPIKQEEKNQIKKWLRASLKLTDKIDFDFRDHPKVNS